MNKGQRVRLTHALRKSKTNGAVSLEGPSTAIPTEARSGPSLLPEKSKPRVGLWRIIFVGLSAVGSAAGIFALALQFLPSISVEPGLPFKDDQAFLTEFKFQNTGSLTLRNLRFALLIDNRVLRTVGSGQIVFPKMPAEPTLEPGDSTTRHIPISFSTFEGGATIRINTPPEEATIEIVVTFEVLHLPVVFRRTSRFVSHTDGSGRWYWLPRPARGRM
jgi:hypothetical protein